MKTIIKNILILCASLCCIGKVSAVSYSVATVGGYGPYQAGVGGEFTLKANDSFLNDIVANYAFVAKNQYGNAASQPNFQTFCVEGAEYINANTAYDVVLNDHTVYLNNYLTKGAAYLYSQFAQGTLSGYNYASGRLSSADQLQRALWALMGGQEGEIYNLANPFETLVTSVFGDWSTANSQADSGEYGVYVLNMWQAGHVDEIAYKAQDQLIWNPCVPDTGSSLILMGISFGGLALVSGYLRRRNPGNIK